MSDIVERLRAMSRAEHTDLSIGDEAADEIDRLRAENERLKEALIGIEEYWNGSYSDGAMSNALDVIVSRARAALEGRYD